MQARLGALLFLVRLLQRRRGLLALITGLGLLLALVLLCLVPLGTALAVDAQAQQVLAGRPVTETNLEADITARGITPQLAQQIRQRTQTLGQQQLASFAPDSMTYLTSNFLFLATIDGRPLSQVRPDLVGALGQAYAFDLAQAAPHMRLLAGHLPQASPPAPHRRCSSRRSSASRQGRRSPWETAPPR